VPRISHFDIPDDDPIRAQKFHVFDWKFDKWDGSVYYWMVKTGDEEPRINGGLSKRMSGQIGMTNTINVMSIDEFSKKVIEKGEQVLVPKMEIPKKG